MRAEVYKNFWRKYTVVKIHKNEMCGLNKGDLFFRKWVVNIIRRNWMGTSKLWSLVSLLCPSAFGIRLLL